MFLSALINISTRIFYLGVGGMGAITIIPNIMSSASGTTEAHRAADTGLFASGLFILSGITGVIHNPFIPLWIAHVLGLAGCIAQSRAFYLMDNQSKYRHNTSINPQLTGTQTAQEQIVIPFLTSITIESIKTICWAYSQVFVLAYHIVCD